MNSFLYHLNTQKCLIFKHFPYIYKKNSYEPHSEGRQYPDSR